MYGRYGNDQLGQFMLWSYIIMFGMNIFIRSYVISALALVLAILTIWRMFSRNISARNKENLKYLSIKRKFVGFFKLNFDRVRDARKKVYKKCPSCHAVVRLPRKGGKHSATCPACKSRFSLRILPFWAIILISVAVVLLIAAAITGAILLKIFVF